MPQLKRSLRVAVFSAFAVQSGCIGDRGTSESRNTDESPAARYISVSGNDTLRAVNGVVLARPIWITSDRQARFIAVDQSDKNLKIYDSAGRLTSAVGKPGQGLGEFMVLLGGGTLGDSLWGYDFSSTTLSVFAPNGVYARQFRLRRGSREPMPANVRSVDDSLFLVTSFTVGAESKEIVRLVRRDGSLRSAFYNRASYYTPFNVDLAEATPVVADASHGLVLVAQRGIDSVFAYDYDGRQLASGLITLRDGTSPPQYKSILAKNSGKRRRPDQTLVTDGFPEVVEAIVLDSRHAVLQVAVIDYQKSGDLDVSKGGQFMIASIDPSERRVSISGYQDLPAGLIGRTHTGEGLLLRYVSADYQLAELRRLSLASKP